MSAASTAQCSIRRSSPVDPALRSLITVRVSQINHCPFCVDLNSATLMKRGASSEKVAALDRWTESSLFSEREGVTIEYAEAMTYSDRGVDDPLMARLRRHFDEDGTVELTGRVAFQNLSSKFNSALDVPPRGFCKMPARDGRWRDLLVFHAAPQPLDEDIVAPATLAVHADSGCGARRTSVNSALVN